MRTRRSTGMRVIALLTALAIAPATTVAQTTDEPDETFDEELESLQEFGQLSLEELMAIPVTSIMGTEQALLDSPAAIYVISNEDLRRGGYRTIADALRMVPGMQVGQVTSNIWAVTSRGFNGRFGDMLLVLIDGRAVYTPLFAGVFWDVQDVVMEDVDRIEVIRGPGATLWGANAVNGVINIVTRSAEETQGLLITAGGGDHEQGFGALRYGGQIADNAWFRVWTKYDNRNHFENAAGISQPDDWHTWRTGFRLDVEPDSDTTLQFQAELFDGGHGNLWNVAAPTAPFSATVRDDLDRDGGHLLAKVMRDVSATTGWSLLAYYDMDRFSSSVISEDRRTYDIEFRHHTLMGDRHELVWGLGYRHYEDETTGSFALSFVPPDRSFGKFSAFIQDQIELEPDRWSLLIGSKFEHNDFTGFEVQPSARLLWTPDDNQAVWASVSRAVRTPARNEDELNLVLDVVPPGTPARLLGNRDVESETLIAYEAGYRVRPSDTLTVDVAAFFNDYDNLITITGPAPRRRMSRTSTTRPASRMDWSFR